MNWYIITPVIVAVIVLLYFITRKNFKDEKKFEQQLKDDYLKPKEDEQDADTEKPVH